MISSEEVDIWGVFDFKEGQKKKNLDTTIPSIDIVAQKQIAALRRKASVFKKSQ